MRAMTAWSPTVFADRSEAGRLLARELRLQKRHDPVVIGLARGGVAVAAEVARELEAPLDALAVRKVGHPWQPEYAIGAVTPDGRAYVRGHDGLTDEQVEGAVEAARRKAEALDARLHAGRPPVPVAGRACLLVDDGLATGATMIAAVRWARAEGARRVVVAVPVGAASTVARLGSEADEVVVLEAPEDFVAVGFWYQDFEPVEDEDVLALLGAAGKAPVEQAAERAVAIPADGVTLPGELAVPGGPRGAVLFAHGSGSSRLSPRNRLVAGTLREAGLATLLFDLLTEPESADRRNVFDIALLASRLEAAHRWLQREPEGALPVGYFGASTGAAAALWAAAGLGAEVRAVVSRGGRPDLAGPRLPLVGAPTLLIVGGLDDAVLDLNREAERQLVCEHALVVVPGATHLFEEPGTLERAAAHAARWFERHLS
jgi:predicted phosphoribosyltransferase/dienelactone hydrolase